jgi:hypothetical protein
MSARSDAHVDAGKRAAQPPNRQDRINPARVARVFVQKVRSTLQMLRFIARPERSIERWIFDVSPFSFLIRN